MSDDKLEQALDLYERGYSLLPLAPRDKMPHRGLLPLNEEGKASWSEYRQRRASRAEIRGWYAEDPAANLGLLTGSASLGLVVVDFDGPTPSGIQLPPTVAVQTAKGHHYYYRTHQPLGSFKFTLGATSGDVKADGGYVACPPSTHPSGAVYSWAECLSIRDVDVAPLPVSLLEVLTGNRVQAGDSNSRLVRPAHSLPSESSESFVSSVLGGPSTPCSKINIYLATPPTPGTGTETVPACRAGEFTSMAGDIQTVRKVLNLIGVQAGEPKRGMRCPFVGHDFDGDGKEIGHGPSAAMFTTDSGALVMRCFHHQENYLPVDLYYMAITHSKKKPPAGIKGVWWLRALAEAGVIQPAYIPFAPLPADAPPAALKLYQGFVYLLQLRALWKADQLGAPYSWDFARGWVGIGSNSTISKGMKYLFEKHYLKRAGTEQGLTMIALDQPWDIRTRNYTRAHRSQF